MANTNSNSPPLILLCLFILSATAYGRLITNHSSSDLVSDGLHDGFQAPPLLLLRTSDSCDQTYGFLPCTTTVLGNIFLVLVYGYLMFLAATYLSNASELLLEILGPGIVGGLCLPIFGSLPDAMLILEMATVIDAAAIVVNVGGDQNPEATGLPIPAAVTFVVNSVAVIFMVNPVVALVIPGGPLNHLECSKKFTGVNFKRWQEKMKFYLTTLNLVRFLSEDPPAVEENEQDKQRLIALEAWKQSDFLFQNYVLNGLADSLFNVFYAKKSTKELWDALDKKYKTEDAGAKKFVIGRFLDFEMVDSKTVISQVQEFQVILHEINAEEMFLSESFQVAALIEKLPNSWKDFKNYLKHKRKEMTVKELVVRL